MLKSTKCRILVPPAVFQAAPSTSVATILYDDSMGEDIPINPHPNSLVTPPTAPTIVDRPPAALVPVTAVPPTSAISNHATFSNHSPSLSHVSASMTKNVYPKDATSWRDNQLGTIIDGGTKESHGKSGDNPMSFDLAIPCNDCVPSHTPETTECASEKSTFDGLVESSPTQTASCDDEDEPSHSSGALAILKSLTSYHYGDFLHGQFSFPVPNKLLHQHSLVNSHVSM